MAVQKTQKKGKMTAAETRARAESAITKLSAKGAEANKERIARLTAALEKGDDELQETDVDRDIDMMDIENEESNDGPGGQGQGSSNKQPSNTADGEQADSDDKNAADTAGGGQRSNSEQPTTIENEKEANSDEQNATDTGGEQGDNSGSNSHSNSKTHIKKEAYEDDKPLFVPQTGSSLDTDDEDSEYGASLFRRPGPKLGQDVTTVGWAGGRRTQYINMYGKKSAARYRLESSAETAEYEDEQPESQRVSNPNNRYGDFTQPNGKPKFTKRHIRGIFGIAWAGVNSGNYRDDLKLIDPNLHHKPWPITYVLVAWDVNGETKKTWEPRQTLRVRWGKKDADIAIFKAAWEAEERCEEAQTGKRTAHSRSPSHGLVEDTARQFREQSLAAKPVSFSRGSRSPVPENMSPEPMASTASMEELAEQLAKFKIAYCECAGVSRFQDLGPGDKADFVASWQHQKSQLVTAS
jgi:hypothetical protein